MPRTALDESDGVGMAGDKTGTNNATARRKIPFNTDKVVGPTENSTSTRTCARSAAKTYPITAVDKVVVGVPGSNTNARNGSSGGWRTVRGSGAEQSREGNKNLGFASADLCKFVKEVLKRICRRRTIGHRRERYGRNVDRKDNAVAQIMWNKTRTETLRDVLTDEKPQ